MSKDNKDDYTKIWSLEEIDALLSDSVSTSPPESASPPQDKTRIIKNPKDAIYNPRFSQSGTGHNIKTTKVEHSPTGDITPIESKLPADKYRERFINRPVRNLEKTEDYSGEFGINPEKPIEKHGVIKRKSQFKHTQDLSPLPILVSPEEVLLEDAREQKTMVRGILDADEKEREIKQKKLEHTLNQIKIEGFDDTAEPVQKTNEAQIEKELYERRKEKAKEFTVNRGILPEAENDENSDTGVIYSKQSFEKQTRKEVFTYDNDEFRFADDKNRFTYSLKKRYKSAKTSLILEVFSFCVLALLSFIPSLGEEVTFKLFGGSEKVFLLVCAAIAAIGIGAGMKTIKKGFSQIIHLKFGAAACALLAVAAVTIQLLLFFIASGVVLSSIPLYLIVGIGALVFYEAGEILRYKRTLSNFEFISETNPLYSVESICKEDEAFEIGRGLLLGEPDIKASFKTLFPEKFMELSVKRFISDELSTKLFPIVLVLSVVTGIIAAVLSRDYKEAISTFTAVLCIGIPSLAYFSDNMILSEISGRLLEDGAMISGYEAADDFLSANAIALDSSEVFDTTKCNIYGIKTFHGMRIDEAILHTAAMLIEAKAPLSGIFDSVILGRRELLPPVETIAYEDKLGLSAWIHNRRVLVGNRDLLINHNVKAPNKDFEKKYLNGERYPLYLAIEGKIAAMFIVSYEANSALSPLIRNVERNGITLLLKTTDANITEEFISLSLRIPQSGTKVLSAVAGEMLDECKNEVKKSSPAHVLHDGTTYSMLKALSAVFSLDKFKSITMIMNSVGSAIGIAFTAVLALSSGLMQAGPLKIIFYQLFWSVITVILLKIKNKK